MPRYKIRHRSCTTSAANRPIALYWQLLLLFIMPTCLTACTKEAQYLYSLSDLQLHNENNSGPTPTDDTTGSVDVSAYAIRIGYTAKVDSTTPGTPVSGESHFYGPGDIAQFNISSTTGFDSTHPAGASLNDCFVCLRPSDPDGVYIYPVTSTGISGAYLFTGLNFDLDHPHDARSASQHLLLVKQPAVLGLRTFALHVTFADSATFTASVTVNLR